MPVAIDSLPSGIQGLARHADQHFGNADGLLDSGEIDRFEAVHGDNPIYRAHLIDPVRGRLGTPAGPVVKPYDPSIHGTPVDSDTRTAARALLQPAGTATEEDCDIILEQLVRVPAKVLGSLLANGCRVTVCRGSVTEHRTEYQGVRPPGWPPGRTWDDVPGAFFRDTNEVVIATISTNGKRSLPKPGGTTHNCANLVIHEVGHAYDHCSAAIDTPAFRRAYDADLDRLSFYERTPAPAGPQEAFAETFAKYCVVRPEVLQIKRPHLFAYFEDLLR